ncbi:MAG TPA: hypothetical protein VF082_04905 [Jiangellaceae bacterium]
MTLFHYEVSRLRQPPTPREEVVSRIRRLIAAALTVLALVAGVGTAIALGPHPTASVALGGSPWCC